ncbi:hypothetical protein BJX66DRAFT_39284 [Aspergillus keveii]|uniref:Uncharacterized protein n=1 Tax=Aspergillus keveii TaxID=714993 RepID=A0ABR4FSF7_9EURO
MSRVFPGPMRQLPRIILRAAPRARCIECAFYGMARRRTWLIPLSGERPVEIGGCEFVVLHLQLCSHTVAIAPAGLSKIRTKGTMDKSAPGEHIQSF